MNLRFLLSAIFLITSCKSDPGKPTVYVFLSTECPLSQEQTFTLNSLYDYYNPKVEFIGVFPNSQDDPELIDEFSTKFSIQFKLVSDGDHKLKNQLNASVTPEVFLLSDDGNLLYSGKLDNRMISLGKKRKVITENYLKDALGNYLNGRQIRNKQTTPVGCIIFDSAENL